MSKKNITVAILGAGNMGTALGQIIATNGYQIKLWNYAGDPEPLDQIIAHHENKKYLPGIKLSHNLKAEKDLEKAVRDSKIIFFVLPSNCIGGIIKCSAPFMSPGTVCVDVSKGLDTKTLDIITDVMKKMLPAHSRAQITTISGPAIAVEMVKGGFTAMNIASRSKNAVQLVKKILCNDNLRLKETQDIIGVELGGSFKNIYAIAIGICDFYKWPMNTKAAILVSGMKETSTLLQKIGGKEETVFDLAGLGDLIGTALSVHSRNRRFGEYLPESHNKDITLKKVGQVVEGVEACTTALALAKKHKVKMPLASAINKIINKGIPADITLKKFLKTIS